MRISKRHALWLIVVAGASAVVFALAPPVREFIAVDRCLDAGGAFDYAAAECRFGDADDRR